MCNVYLFRAGRDIVCITLVLLNVEVIQHVPAPLKYLSAFREGGGAWIQLEDDGFIQTMFFITPEPHLVNCKVLTDPLF